MYLTEARRKGCESSNHKEVRNIEHYATGTYIETLYETLYVQSQGVHSTGDK